MTEVGDKTMHLMDSRTKEKRQMSYGMCVWCAGVAPRDITKELMKDIPGQTSRLILKYFDSFKYWNIIRIIRTRINTDFFNALQKYFKGYHLDFRKLQRIEKSFSIYFSKIFVDVGKKELSDEDHPGFCFSPFMDLAEKSRNITYERVNTNLCNVSHLCYPPEFNLYCPTHFWKLYWNN